VKSSRSTRTSFEDKAGLAHPMFLQEIAERFLDLLVAGADYDLVGFEQCCDWILGDAPGVADPTDEAS
jgi:hypothetical protein